MKVCVTGCEASVEYPRIWSGALSPSGTERPLRFLSCVSVVAVDCSRATTVSVSPVATASAATAADGVCEGVSALPPVSPDGTKATHYTLAEYKNNLTPLLLLL